MSDPCISTKRLGYSSSNPATTRQTLRRKLFSNNYHESSLHCLPTIPQHCKMGQRRPTLLRSIKFQQRPVTPVPGLLVTAKYIMHQPTLQKQILSKAPSKGLSLFPSIALKIPRSQPLFLPSKSKPCQSTRQSPTPIPLPAKSYTINEINPDLNIPSFLLPQTLNAAPSSHANRPHPSQDLHHRNGRDIIDSPSSTQLQNIPINASKAPAPYISLLAQLTTPSQTQPSSHLSPFRDQLLNEPHPHRSQTPPFTLVSKEPITSQTSPTLLSSSPPFLPSDFLRRASSHPLSPHFPILLLTDQILPLLPDPPFFPPPLFKSIYPPKPNTPATHNSQSLPFPSPSPPPLHKPWCIPFSKKPHMVWPEFKGNGLLLLSAYVNLFGLLLVVGIGIFLTHRGR